MSYRFVVASCALLVSMHPAAVIDARAQALPVKNGRPVVATVNRDWVFLDELVAQLDPTAERARLQQGRASAKELEQLDRLVNVRLVMQEAATMGLADLPEIRKEVEVSSRAILREVLVARTVKDVRADPAEVEKGYRELVKEWQTSSLLFQDEAQAKRARDEIAKGARFADVAARVVAAKTAKAEGDTAYHGRKAYMPPVAQVLDALQAGQVSPVIRIQAGFVILTVTSIRYPENPAARAEAQAAALRQRQTAFLEAHERELLRKYVVINKAVLNGVNYEAAKPSLEVLLKDKRVVAEIKGSASVTVADLTDYLRLQFFHGPDRAGQGKRMNERKEAALSATVGRRLLNAEALRLGIDKTPEYQDKVRAYKENLVFDRFVQKVIVPDSKMREEEVREYYDSHRKDYSYPEMKKLRGLAFTTRAAAEGAMGKLRGGANFSWLVANSPGQVDKAKLGLRIVEGQPVLVSSMPEGMQKAVAGAKAGDYRLYASPEGHFYLLAIQEVITPNAKPYEQVREEIAKKLYGEKLNKAMSSYFSKLRTVSKIQVHLQKMS